MYILHLNLCQFVFVFVYIFRKCISVAKKVIYQSHVKTGAGDASLFVFVQFVFAFPFVSFFQEKYFSCKKSYMPSGLMRFIFLFAFVFVWFALVRCVFVFEFLSTSNESHTAVAKKAYVQVTCLAVRYSQKYSYTNTYNYTNIQIYTRILAILSPMRKSPFSLLSVLFVCLGWLDGQRWDKANFQCSKIHLLRLSSVLLTPRIRDSPNCCSVTRKKGWTIFCHQCIAMWTNILEYSVSSKTFKYD